MSERKSDLPDMQLDSDKQPGLVGDLLKRAVLTGVGALFMTEEGIRNAVGEMKLPKDVLAFLVSQAERTRTDVARVVTAELRRFLESETLRREVWKLLTGITLEVNATIQLKPTGEPGFKATIRQAGEKPPTSTDPRQAPVPAPVTTPVPGVPGGPGDSGAP